MAAETADATLRPQIRSPASTAPLTLTAYGRTRRKSLRIKLIKLISRIAPLSTTPPLATSPNDLFNDFGMPSGARKAAELDGCAVVKDRSGSLSKERLPSEERSVTSVQSVQSV